MRKKIIVLILILVGIVFTLFPLSQAFAAPVPSPKATIKVTSAYQIISAVTPRESWEVGPRKINLPRKSRPELPTLVYIYFKNEGKEPVSIKDIVWEGRNLEKRFKDFSLIWWRLLPDPLPSGKEGEISLCLRRALERPTEFTIIFSDGSKHTALVDVAPPPFRIKTINFGEDLRRIYLYIESSVSPSPLPERVYLNGKEITEKVQWLSNDYVRNLRACIINLPSPLKRGSIHTFRVTSNDGKATSAITLRAFNNLAVFGTYGRTTFERFAQSRLSVYHSFFMLDKPTLDRAHRVGIRTVITTNEREPLKELIGHPGLFAYSLRDEPDARDYTADKTRPMRYRLGTLGQRMVDAHSLTFKKDPITPTMISIDLTFVPGNYFVYGPIADISNPNYYPARLAQPIWRVLQHASINRIASAPRPFTFTYEGYWERFAIRQDRYIGGEELRERGFETFVDPTRIRGFGRPITPSEIRIKMLYAIAAGAKGLFSFMDASELVGTVLFHGTDVLPDNWKEIGRTSRALTMVAPLIDIGHSFDWAGANNDFVRIGTLLCGEEAALVVVVNENYTSNRDGFFQEPLKNVQISFPDLPWFRPTKVVRVEDKKFTPLEHKRDAKGLVWKEKELKEGEIYLIVENPEIIKTLKTKAETFFNKQARAIGE